MVELIGGGLGMAIGESIAMGIGGIVIAPAGSQLFGVTC